MTTTKYTAAHVKRLALKVQDAAETGLRIAARAEKNPQLFAKGEARRLLQRTGELLARMAGEPPDDDYDPYED